MESRPALFLTGWCMRDLQSEFGELQSLIIRYFLPNIDKTCMKRLKKLIKEKGVETIHPDFESNICALFCSIARHTATDYENIVKQVGKEKARFIVHPITTKLLEEARRK
jgi:hypothetical protein